MSIRSETEVYNRQLTQKYCSLKLQEIKTRKCVFGDDKNQSKLFKLNSIKKIAPLSQAEKLIAMQNLQLLKRLAEVRYKDAEIKKMWSTKQLRSSSKDCPRRIIKFSLKERERLTENQRLGKSIQEIAKRRKLRILPKIDS